MKMNSTDTNVVATVAETRGPTNCGVGFWFTGILRKVIGRRRHEGVVETGGKRGR